MSVNMYSGYPQLAFNYSKNFSARMHRSSIQSKTFNRCIIYTAPYNYVARGTASASRRMQPAPNRRFMCTHQIAALFHVKWRHGRHLGYPILKVWHLNDIFTQRLKTFLFCSSVVISGQSSDLLPDLFYCGEFLLFRPH